MPYDTINILRYMGNKVKLLDFIIPIIFDITSENETICDLMAGTNAVSYTLKKRNRLIVNDIQYYSYIIGKAIIENNNVVISKDSALIEILDSFNYNKKKKEFRFFFDNYSDTYFSAEQCLDIDSIRYAISKIKNDYKKCLYLSSLMHVMCKIQSTPGHFAQYMPKDHKRIIPLRQKNVWELFLEKCNDFKQIINNNFNNISYNKDYKILFEQGLVNDVSCFYLDPPYTGEQYSRFYHVLETICKYDNPKLKYKALYRENRFKSNFCYKRYVYDEFEYVIRNVANLNSKLVISYSNNGVADIQEIISLGKSYFSDVKLFEQNYYHSTQGKGYNRIKEFVIVMQ